MLYVSDERYGKVEMEIITAKEMLGDMERMDDMEMIGKYGKGRIMEWVNDMEKMAYMERM